MGKNGVKSTAFPNSISNTLKKRRTQFKKTPKFSKNDFTHAKLFKIHKHYNKYGTLH